MLLPLCIQNNKGFLTKEQTLKVLQKNGHFILSPKATFVNSLHYYNTLCTIIVTIVVVILAASPIQMLLSRDFYLNKVTSSSWKRLSWQLFHLGQGHPNPGLVARSGVWMNLFPWWVRPYHSSSAWIIFLVDLGRLLWAVMSIHISCYIVFWDAEQQMGLPQNVLVTRSTQDEPYWGRNGKLRSERGPTFPSDCGRGSGWFWQIENIITSFNSCEKWIGLLSHETICLRKN